MIKKGNRLRKKKDIEIVFKSGRSFYSDFLGAKYLNNGLGINRYCVVVSANISKKAVIRNKIKRRVKAALLLEGHLLFTGFDFLVIAKKNILGLDFSEIKTIVRLVLKKVGAYK